MPQKELDGLYLQRTIQPDSRRDRPLPCVCRQLPQTPAVSTACSSASPYRACQLAQTVWPLHFPSCRSPSSRCFLSTNQINCPWGHTAMGPPSYQSALGVLYSAASQHHHRSQHRQLASPSRRGRTLLRHQIAGPAPFLNTALE